MRTPRRRPSSWAGFGQGRNACISTVGSLHCTTLCQPVLCNLSSAQAAMPGGGGLRALPPPCRQKSTKRLCCVWHSRTQPSDGEQCSTAVCNRQSQNLVFQYIPQSKRQQFSGQVELMRWVMFVSFNIPVPMRSDAYVQQSEHCKKKHSFFPYWINWSWGKYSRNCVPGLL